MAWQKKHTEGTQEHIDLRTGMHVIPLHDPESGAEHVLQIHIGHAVCPACGAVREKAGAEGLDPKEIVAAELRKLETSHGRLREYGRRHGVGVRSPQQGRRTGAQAGKLAEGTRRLTPVPEVPEG